MNTPRPLPLTTSKALQCAVALSIVASIGACTWNKDRSGKIGGAVGGILGGVMGAKVSQGTGRTVATIIGATLGAMWGEDMARGMTDIDKIFAERTTKDTLEYGKPGDPVSWSNPQSGNSGQVKADHTYKNKEGEDCRKFETTAEVGGEERITKGTACRLSNGDWKVQDNPA